MENIRLLLIRISERLFKSFSLFGGVKNVSDLTDRIKEAPKEELYRIAVYMLDFAVTNNKFYSCKDFFNVLYDETVRMLSESEQYNEYFVSSILGYFKQMNYPVYLDGSMNAKDISKGLCSNKIKVMIPEELTENVLVVMYGKGASIYECGTPVSISDNIIFDDFDALLYFGNGFEMDISYYNKDNSGNLVTRKYFKDENGQMVINHDVFNEVRQSLCYSSVSGTNMFIETPELEYVRASKGGTDYDFVRMMRIKDKVNRKKIAAIRSFEDNSTVKKDDKTYGL